MTGPTEQQGHELFKLLVSIQTIASSPTSSTEGMLDQAVTEVYRFSPHYSVLGMASYAASRLAMIESSIAVPGSLAFPRDALLQKKAPNVPMDLHSRCVDLIEANKTGDPADDQVQSLVDDYGVDALYALTVLTLVTGMMVADVDPTVTSVPDLVAQEGVDSESAWFRRGESYRGD